MRRIGVVKGLKRFSLFRFAQPMVMALFVMIQPAPSPAADRIAVFPTTPLEGYVIYESLAIFWLAIIGLIVIIRMKLREIERIQEMGIDKEDKDAPLLQ